jgi:DNA-directed RNA polymerase subunit E'/Rpb7
MEEVAYPSASLNTLSVKLPVSLHPSRLGDTNAGIEEHIDKLLLRFNKNYGGAVLAYWDIQRIRQENERSLSLIQGTRPFISFDVSFKCIAFVPELGDSIRAVVNAVSNDYISLLVHGFFNMTVKKQGIPENWLYDAELHTFVDIDTKQVMINVGEVVFPKVTSVYGAAQEMLNMKGAFFGSELFESFQKYSGQPCRVVKRKQCMIDADEADSADEVDDTKDAAEHDAAVASAAKRRKLDVDSDDSSDDSDNEEEQEEIAVAEEVDSDPGSDSDSSSTSSSPAAVPVEDSSDNNSVNDSDNDSDSDSSSSDSD